MDIYAWVKNPPYMQARPCSTGAPTSMTSPEVNNGH